MDDNILKPSSWAMRDSLVFLRKATFEDTRLFGEPDDEECHDIGSGAEAEEVTTNFPPELGPTSAKFSRWPSADGFVSTPPSLAVLDNLLKQAVGSDQTGRRSFPSAGATYSISLCVALFESLEVATVREFDLESGKLGSPSTINARELWQSVLSANEARFGTGTAILFYIVNLERALQKYQHRGLLFAMMDVGAMYQNVLRDAQSYGLGSRVWGGFAPFRTMKLLRLNPSETPIVMAHLLGFPK